VRLACEILLHFLIITADSAVSYLPMPVVGGYLAFIGYFCLQAGVALCISKAMTQISDWKYLLDGDLLLLATPGLLSGLLFTLISRKATSDAALPAAMAGVPLLFYVILFFSGVGLEGAREAGWVGQEAPSVPVTDLFHLVDFSLVQWGLVSDILFTWVGMV
jgi:SulP family sulfate permease